MGPNSMPPQSSMPNGPQNIMGPPDQGHPPRIPQPPPPGPGPGGPPGPRGNAEQYYCGPPPVNHPSATYYRSLN